MCGVLLERKRGRKMYTQLQHSDVMSYFIDLVSPNSQDLTTNKSHIYICIAYQTARCLDVLKLLSVWLLSIGLEWGVTEIVFSKSDGFSVGSCVNFVTSISKRLTKDSLFSGLACTMRLRLHSNVLIKKSTTGPYGRLDSWKFQELNFLR